MKNKITIHEGFTNNYLIPGVFAIVLSLVSIFFFGLFSIILIVASIILVSGSNGLEIDQMGKQYRKYGSFAGVKIGNWKRFEKPVFAKLHLSSENISVGGSVGMVGYLVPNQGKLSSITYDIYLETEFGDWVRVYDFLEYKTAKKALKAIETEMKLPVLDKVREKLIENKNKRQMRGNR